MPSPKFIWSDYPLSTRIATSVCYAAVFGDAIGVNEMESRFGQIGHDEFCSSLEEMSNAGKIILRDGYAVLPYLDSKIDLKAAEKELAGRLLNAGTVPLKKFGRSPIIKFVGVSGSVAAGNPTKDRNGAIDLDVFVITRNQCLWLYVIPRSLRGLFNRKTKEPSLCFNLVFDESDLEVRNKNYYTATEIINLIPVSGMDTYSKFLQVNSWVNDFYPEFSVSSSFTVPTNKYNFVNKGLYLIFNLLRSIKKLNLKPLRDLTFRNDHLAGEHFNRMSHKYGGYQPLIQTKFIALASRWFPEMIDSSLIDKLFPDNLSIALRRGEIDIQKLREEGVIHLDYGKYE